jgi:UDP-N-acetyl-D-mannosaminuronate dehydrogenase
VESIENSNKKEIEAKEIEAKEIENKEIENKEIDNKEIEIEEIEKKEVEKKVIEDKELDESGVNSVLLQFLDAKSYNDKLAVMMSKRKSINDRLLNDMAVSIDCTIEEGTIEERIKGLIFALETLARFENKRLR